MTLGDALFLAVLIMTAGLALTWSRQMLKESEYFLKYDLLVEDYNKAVQLLKDYDHDYTSLKDWYSMLSQRYEDLDMDYNDLYENYNLLEGEMIYNSIALVFTLAYMKQQQEKNRYRDNSLTA